MAFGAKVVRRSEPNHSECTMTKMNGVYGLVNELGEGCSAPVAVWDLQKL